MCAYIFCNIKYIKIALIFLITFITISYALIVLSPAFETQQTLRIKEMRTITPALFPPRLHPLLCLHSSSLYLAVSQYSQYTFAPCGQSLDHRDYGRQSKFIEGTRLKALSLSIAAEPTALRARAPKTAPNVFLELFSTKIVVVIIIIISHSLVHPHRLDTHSLFLSLSFRSNK